MMQRNREDGERRSERERDMKRKTRKKEENIDSEGTSDRISYLK